MPAAESGGSCQEVPISAGSVSDGWGDASVPVGESGSKVCGGSGCAVTSGYWAVEVRAGSWDGAIVFCEGADSSLGNTGSGGRPAGFSKAARGSLSSPLAAASSAFFSPWAEGSRKAASTTSLAHGSVTDSVTPEVSIWAGADDRVGVGVSSSSIFCVVCFSSPGSKTGMIGLSALWVLKSAIG